MVPSTLVVEIINGLTFQFDMRSFANNTAYFCSLCVMESLDSCCDKRQI